MRVGGTRGAGRRHSNAVQCSAAQRSAALSLSLSLTASVRILLAGRSPWTGSSFENSCALPTAAVQLVSAAAANAGEDVVSRLIVLSDLSETCGAPSEDHAGEVSASPAPKTSMLWALRW
jgi:hypothetical protein